MLYDKTPKKFSCDAVITMYYSVSSIHNRFGIGEFKRWVNFQDPIYSFSHDFNISFYGSLSEHVILKILKQFGCICKETFHFYSRIEYID